MMKKAVLGTLALACVALASAPDLSTYTVDLTSKVHGRNLGSAEVTVSFGNCVFPH